MKIVSGFFVYRVYITYKAHFSASNSDISKYGYRLFNPSYDTFLDTKGHSYYDKIAKLFKTEMEVTNLLISAFLDDPDVWIGTICLDIEKYRELKEKREALIQNMPYVFAKDCKYLFLAGMKFDKTLGEFVFNELMQSAIELETFIILKKIFKFNIDNNTTYDYIYRIKYTKYENLLRVDVDKYKSILKEVVMQNRD